MARVSSVTLVPRLRPKDGYARPRPTIAVPKADTAPSASVTPPKQQDTGTHNVVIMLGNDPVPMLIGASYERAVDYIKWQLIRGSNRRYDILDTRTGRLVSWAIKF